MVTQLWKHLAITVLGSLALVGTADAQSKPSLDDTIRYISTYLQEKDDHLGHTGTVLIYDHAPKCAYDSKVPLLSLSRRITLDAPGDGRLLVTLRCAEKACIRQYSDCDHRANAALSEVDLVFRADKRSSVEAAFKHLFDLLPDLEADPF